MFLTNYVFLLFFSIDMSLTSMPSVILITHQLRSCQQILRFCQMTSIWSSQSSSALCCSSIPTWRSDTISRLDVTLCLRHSPQIAFTMSLSSDVTHSPSLLRCFTHLSCYSLPMSLISDVTHPGCHSGCNESHRLCTEDCCIGAGTWCMDLRLHLFELLCPGSVTPNLGSVTPSPGTRMSPRMHTAAVRVL